MEKLRNSIENNIQRKQEVVGIHANAILQKNIADAHTLNKWMDALCMDETIARKALWEEIYEEMKPQLNISKQFLDTENKKEIRALPEFQIFLEEYKKEEIKREQKRINQQTTESIKNVFDKRAEPEDIKKAKEQEAIFNGVRNNSNSIMKKYEWERIFDAIGKSTISEWQIKQLYEFIFEYVESPNNKKKRMKNESISDFYKRSGIDYRCDEKNKKIFNKEIEKRIIKLKEKINKWEDREKNTIEEKIYKEKTEEEKRDYEQEAMKIFIHEIDNNKNIKERFYLPKEREDIENIQNYFKKQLKETIVSPNKEILIKDYTTPLHTIEKSWKNIKTHPQDYLEIERRKIEYKKRFTSGDRNPREYLFDRLIEYIGKDILTYKINKLIKKNPQYKGTKISILMC